jgi:hypothetical protein
LRLLAEVEAEAPVEAPEARSTSRGCLTEAEVSEAPEAVEVPEAEEPEAVAEAEAEPEAEVSETCRGRGRRGRTYLLHWTSSSL